MRDYDIRVFGVQPQVNALEKDIGLAGHEFITIPEVVEENETNRIPVGRI